MYTVVNRIIIASALLVACCGIRAESDIDRLIEQTGNEVGSVAVRDMSGWRELKKIVILDAEHMVAMLLSLARGLPQYAKAMPGGGWSENYGVVDSMQKIEGKTVLVVGLGGIGTEIARRAAALGMRVVGTRRSSRSGPDFVAYVGLSDELVELAAEADFVFNALPLTPESTGIYDKTFFAGAGLDVTDPEPLPAEHPQWQFDNVIITPHAASGGGNRERQQLLLLENLKRFVAGDALLNVVDPEQGY